jgi:predicted metal-binding membrane protein
MMAPRAFTAGAALAFVASAAVTVLWCGAMAAMPGMDMPGGWTMSMAWMRMPGQSWAAAGGAFLGMWSVMMVAMMLPAITPRLRQVTDGRFALVMALGYFTVWTLLGVLAYPVGMAWSALVMGMPSLSRLVPVMAGLVLMGAGLLQFTRWKAAMLACCRGSHGCRRPDSARSAWAQGWTLGLRCCYCCAGLTASLLVIGVMDLLAMALTMTAISAERLAPAGVRVARAVGVGVVGAGGFMVVRALM